MKKLSWIMMILWMVVIFYFSHQPGNISSMQSGRVLEKMDLVTMDQVKNHGSDIRDLQFMIRKFAHFAVYLILGILLTLAFKSSNFNRYPMKSFIVGMLYAISDEAHQYFIPGRDMKILDVFIDSIGILVGICFVIYFFSRINLVDDMY